MNPVELIHLAKQAMQRAYTPYSGYKVGAALVTKQGDVYLGCNIENAAFGPSNCAERTAFFTAICAGEREFEAIAVVGGKDGVVTDIFPPCGVCRQALYEFGGDALTVIMAKTEDDYIVTTLGALLPYGFGPANLEK